MIWKGQYSKEAMHLHLLRNHRWTSGQLLPQKEASIMMIIWPFYFKMHKIVTF